MLGRGRHKRFLPAPRQGPASGGVPARKDGQQPLLQFRAGTRTTHERREKQNLHRFVKPCLSFEVIIKMQHV